MSKLAKEFGLSDKILAKKCNKHRIPVPYIGYWAKIKSGKKVIQAKLPQNVDISLETVTFQKRTHSTLKIEIEVESLFDKTQLDKVSSFNFPVRVNRSGQLILDDITTQVLTISSNFADGV